MEESNKLTLRDLYLQTRESGHNNSSATFGDFICNNTDEINEQNIPSYILETLTLSSHFNNKEDT